MNRHDAVLVAIVLGLAACSPDASRDANAATQRRSEVVPVSAAAVAQKDVPIQLRTIGTVEPYSTVAIKSQVEGQLAQVAFHEGEWVRKGQLLFRIDARPFEATLRQAQANLGRDRAEARNADVDADRRARLRAQGFVSADEYDQAQTRAAALRAAVTADEAAVESAKLQLEYCYIASPIDGRVGQILVHEGNVVKSNETTMAVVNQVRPIYVTFSLPERELPGIRERAAVAPLQVQVLVAERTATAVDGELSFINNTVDTTTGTVLLKGLFRNDAEALWPGQFVDVALTLAVQREAAVVPADAIQTGQQGTYVFIVTAAQVAEIRPVSVGVRVGTEVIVTQGLQPGEVVVTDGQIRLAPNVAVHVKHSESGTVPSAGVPTAGSS